MALNPPNSLYEAIENALVENGGMCEVVGGTTLLTINPPTRDEVTDEPAEEAAEDEEATPEPYDGPITAGMTYFTGSGATTEGIPANARIHVESVDGGIVHFVHWRYTGSHTRDRYSRAVVVFRRMVVGSLPYAVEDRK
jgi:hypothetical protein